MAGASACSLCQSGSYSSQAGTPIAAVFQASRLYVFSPFPDSHGKISAHYSDSPALAISQ
jgi:hypothetical protein